MREGSETLQKKKPFGSGILENSALREEEEKTCSPLAFLRPLLREASEKSNSFARNSKKH